MAPGHGSAGDPIVIDSDSDDEMSMGYYDTIKHLTAELLVEQPDVEEYKIIAQVDLICAEDNSPDGEEHIITFKFSISGHQFEDGGSVEELFIDDYKVDAPVKVTSGTVYQLLCDVVVPTIPILGREPGYAILVADADGKTTATTRPMCHLINHETYTKLEAAVAAGH